MITILEDNELIAEICDKEFNCLPPHSKFGDVVAIIEDGELKAFMSREMLIHVGTVWVNHEDRKTVKGAKFLKELLRYVIVNMPRGSSSVVMDETGLYDKLMKVIGLREVPGKTFRIDLSD